MVKLMCVHCLKEQKITIGIIFTEFYSISMERKISKMRKHKFLSFILTGCLLLSGCSGETGEAETTTDGKTYVTVTDDEGNPVTDADGSVVTSAVPDVPEELELRVGFIYSGKAGEDAVSEYFEDARAEIERVLGAKTCYIEDVLVAQFEAATAALVNNNCNVIVSTSNKFANAVHEEAKANPKIQFVSFGGTEGLANLACFQGETYKGSFVCGLAAAYNSDSNILGVVADPAVLSVHNLIDGYIEGAKNLTNDDTDVRVNWAWGNRDSETQAAIDNLVSQGCDVIFAATYSKFAIQYCELLGVKVIGMSFNTPELAPNHYITGTFCNLRLFLIDTLRALRYDTDRVNLYLGGIKEGAVRVIAVNEKAKEGTKDICDAMYDLCAGGDAVIFKGEIKDSKGNVVVKKGEALENDKVLTIDWLEQSVTGELNYCQPQLNPVESDLIIHDSSAQGKDENEETTAAE